MATILMRIRAPMLSWGDHSQFTIRDTRLEPTKSAVIGLLCAALGRPRSQPVNDLAGLAMGVRVDKEGVVQCDYHTVIDGEKPVVSYRYYVADAAYLVGLEGELHQLQPLGDALQAPVWSLYFGRKSFVPSCPIFAGISGSHLEEALQEQPLESKAKKASATMRLRCVIEVKNSLDVRRDVPLNWERRSFGSRCVDTRYLEVKQTCISRN